MTQNLGSTVDKDELRALVAEVIERPVAEVTDEADFVQDLDLDSLMALEIVVRVEKRYGIKVHDEEFADISSLNRVHELVTAKLGDA